METDYALVFGLVIAVLIIPSLVSAWLDGRAPRASALLVVMAGGLIVYAEANKPGGYSFEDIPIVTTQVVGDLLR